MAAASARSRFDDPHATDRLARWSGGVVLIGCVLPSAAPPLVGADHMAGWAPIGLYALGALLGGVALRRGTKERWSAWNGIGLGVGLVLLGLLGRAGVLEWGPFFVPRPPRDPGPPLTEPEVCGWAEELVRELSNDPTGDALLERLDMDTLNRRAGLTVRTRTLERHRQQLAPIIGKQLGGAIVQFARAGGSCRVASLQLDPERQRIVVRLLGTSRWPMYDTFHLVRGPDGRPAIADLQAGLGAPELSFALRLATDEQFRASQPLGGMIVALQAGKAEEVVATWRRLPEPQRGSVAPLVFAYRAACQLGPAAEAELLDAIEDAGAPELGLLLCERLLERSEHRRCEQLVARVQELVDDPYLSAVRADVLLAGGAIDRAQELALRARAEVPELRETWWVVARVGLASGGYAQALEAMQRLAGEFGVGPEELEEELELRIFRITPQGAEWEVWKAAR